MVIAWRHAGQPVVADLEVSRGFLVRPLGGLFFGQLGDRRGRRTALALALIMVSLSTFATGVLPTYSEIGITAPLLLIVCRLLQGFSAGGEWTGFAAVMVESAADDRRGRVPAWHQFSVIAGQIGGC
jgi:MFS transporter, MHS family, proline/betaine transporter